MTRTQAEQYEVQFGAGAIDLDTIAVQKYQNRKSGRTAWIFEDGSALTLIGNVIGIVNNYGLHRDHEQLK